MQRVKKYIISLGVMMIVTIVSLLIVSILTYIFKWQADKAMIGIVVTYVLAGFSGGLSLRGMEKRECGKTDRARIGKKLIEAFILCGVFIIFLLICSVFAFQIPLEFSERVLIVLVLVLGSCFLARIL